MNQSQAQYPTTQERSHCSTKRGLPKPECPRAMSKGSENPAWQRRSRSSPGRLMTGTWRRRPAWFLDTEGRNVCETR